MIVAQSDREALGLGRSAVKMHDYSDDAVHTYVNSGEPLDRAGAYAIQGGGGDLVDSVSGRIDTVVGLDVPLALRLLAEAGYPDPLPAATDVPLAPPRAARRPSPRSAPPSAPEPAFTVGCWCYDAQPFPWAAIVVLVPLLLGPDRLRVGQRSAQGVNITGAHTGLK